MPRCPLSPSCGHSLCLGGLLRRQLGYYRWHKPQYISPNPPTPTVDLLLYLCPLQLQVTLTCAPPTPNWTNPQVQNSSQNNQHRLIQIGGDGATTWLVWVQFVQPEGNQIWAHGKQTTYSQPCNFLPKKIQSFSPQTSTIIIPLNKRNDLSTNKCPHYSVQNIIICL